MAFMLAPSCYVSIPFGEKAYGKDFDAVRQTVLGVLREMEVEPLPVEGDAQSSQLGGTTDALQRADFVIADVTGPSQYVLYELGAAYALKKPIVMIAQEGSDLSTLPGDLARQQVVVYPPGDISELSEYLRRQVRTMLYVARGRFESRA